MTFDLKVPESLKEIQEWFGNVIQQKMTDNFEISLDAISEPYANKYIASTDTLSAIERMELYNQSYWLRLLEALHDEFPLVLRLFGEDEFNKQLGVPYLDYAPPRHWSLNVLGDRFIDFVEQYYTKQDKKLVLFSSIIDWTYQDIFLKKCLPAIDISQYNGKKAEDFLFVSLRLQPTVRLFELPGQIFQFRKEMLEKPVEHWQTHEFPKLVKDKTYYFILYRSPLLNVEPEELCREEYLLLELIEKKKTIECACDALLHIEGVDHAIVEGNISSWIQKWLLRDWICYC